MFERVQLLVLLAPGMQSAFAQLSNYHALGLRMFLYCRQELVPSVRERRKVCQLFLMQQIEQILPPNQRERFSLRALQPSRPFLLAFLLSQNQQSLKKRAFLGSQMKVPEPFQDYGSGRLELLCLDQKSLPLIRTIFSSRKELLYHLHLEALLSEAGVRLDCSLLMRTRLLEAQGLIPHLLKFEKHQAELQSLLEQNSLFAQSEKAEHLKEGD